MCFRLSLGSGYTDAMPATNQHERDQNYNGTDVNNSYRGREKSIVRNSSCNAMSHLRK